MDYLITDIFEYLKMAFAGATANKACTLVIFLIAALALVIPGRKFEIRLVISGTVWSLYLIFAANVLVRTIADVRYKNLDLFWSYEEILAGSREHFFEVLENIILFVPLGICLGILDKAANPEDFPDNPKLRAVKRFVVSMLYMTMYSCAIESAQYFLQVGVLDVDDVFSNALGGFLGYMAVFALVGVVKALFFPKKSVSEPKTDATKPSVTPGAPDNPGIRKSPSDI